MKIEIPIEIIELESESFHLLIRCKVNSSHEGDLVIDTGASKTVLDRNFVPAYQISENQTSEIKSRGLGEGSLKTEMVKIESFQLGDLLVNDFHCALIDLASINEMYMEHCHREICGLLGSDFLLKHRAIINYGSQILQLEIF
jgi:predicted aspartyl protease